MNLNKIGISEKEIGFIKDEKDRKLIIRLRRLQNIVEYLRKKYQIRVLRKIFKIGAKYKNAWNNKIYIYEGGNTMIPLKKDGAKSLVGEETITFWTVDKWMETIGEKK